MAAPDSGGAARGAGARADGLAGGVAWLRRALRRGARVASPGNPLAVAQLELLSVVAEHPGARPGQLARLLHMRPSTVTTIVNARDRDAAAGEHAVPGGCGPGTAVRGAHPPDSTPLRRLQGAVGREAQAGMREREP